MVTAMPAWLHRVRRGARLLRRRWDQHAITDSAAAISFYALVSMVPVLYLGVSAAALILGEPAARGELARQITTVMGEEAAAMVVGIVREIRGLPSESPTTFAIVFLSLLYAGSHVLAKLRETLNVINGADRRDPARPFLGRLFARGLSSLLILLFGGLLVVGTVADGLFGRFTLEWGALGLPRWQVLMGYHYFSSAGLLFLAFAVILKVLPRRRPGWRAVWPGAALGAVLVASFKWVIGVYLRYSPLATVMGTGLTILLFFFWIFLSVEAFLAGAEVTSVIEERRRRADR